MNSSKIAISISLVTLVLLVFTGLLLGSELLAFGDVWDGLTGKGPYQFIIQELRLPRVITAVLSGAALSIAGVLMQTYFRNALAGPYILGISSGGGFGVAVLLLASSFFAIDLSNNWSSTLIFSIIGSASSLFIIMLLSKRIGNGPMLLIAGLMIGSFASAMVSVLQYFAPSEAIKKYLLWTMGSLSSVDLSELWLFGILISLGILASFTISNSLNAFLLGNSEAQSLGISVNRTKWIVMLLTGLLAGIVTAYCGPIAFIGLVAPHLAKIILKSQNHHIIIPFAALIGAILLLLCDIVAQLPGFDTQLPINAVTSLIGAPVVISILLKNTSRNE